MAYYAPELTVTVLPTTELVSKPDEQKICKGAGAVLTLNVKGDSLRYEWYENSFANPNRLADGAEYKGTGTNSLTIVAVNNSSKYLTRVTGTCGTIQVNSMSVKVDGSCKGRIGVDETDELDLSVVVSPNPAPDGQLHIMVRGAQGQPLRVQLVNATGRTITEQRLPKAGQTETLDWNISNHPMGMYLLQAATPTQTKTIKVIK